MDSHSKVNVSSDNEQNAKLLAELAKEEARNAEALRMVKEKELQAIAARDRAADSQRRMQDMMLKYDEMKQKLEWTRLTLEHTASQINQNDIKRAQQIQATVARLKEKAEHCSGILRRKRERDEQNASDTISGPNDDIVAMGDGGSLTDAEKMLLLMCQMEPSADKISEEAQNENNEDNSTNHSSQLEENIKTDCASPIEESTPQETEYDETPLTDAEKMLLLLCQKERSDNNEEAENVKENIKEEQVLHVEESIKQIFQNETSPDSLVESNTLPVTNAEVASEKKKEQDHEEVKNNLNEDNSQTHNTTTPLNALEITEDVTPKATSSVKYDVAEVSEDVDLKDATKDLKETVNNIEAKCAGVREELGQMAMSEQYMRTKQAQLLAKRKEKEAVSALESATKKEQEAQEMRRKVANMMKLLEERKNKLKVTENVLEKRTNVVDKVNKVLDSKLRKADFVQRQRDECLAFDISHNNSSSDKHQTNNNEPTDTEESNPQECSNVKVEPEKEKEARKEEE